MYENPEGVHGPPADAENLSSNAAESVLTSYLFITIYWFDFFYDHL